MICGNLTATENVVGPTIYGDKATVRGIMINGRHTYWWWNDFSPQPKVDSALDRGWAPYGVELTPEEHAALIPIIDDTLLALEYARNPPRFPEDET